MNGKYGAPNMRKTIMGKTLNKQPLKDIITQDNSLINDVLNDFNEVFSMPPKKQRSKSTTLQQKTTVPETKTSTLEELQTAQKKFIEQKQDDNEENILGLDLIELYTQWVQLANRALTKSISKEERDQILKYSPKRISSGINTKILQQPDPTKQGNPGGSLPFIQKRIDRIEERIKALDESKPEYIEERILLESKKSSIENEGGGQPLRANITNITNITDPEIEKSDDQLKTVEDLLRKKRFDSIAPVIPPIKEENARIQHAHLSAKIDDTPIHNIKTKKTAAPKKQSVEKNSTDKQLQEASWMRESFIQNLHRSKATWYENPSKNRDHVNEQIIKIAELLSGKDSFAIDMDDIQTARLFVFNNAPKDILEHPAFSYVESFYNYQNDQGHPGEAVKEHSEITSVKSPYMTAKTTVE